MCLIFEFFQGQNAGVSKKTKALVNYERIYIGERHAREQKKTNSGAQTPVSKTKFWFEKITNQVSDQILVLKQVSRKKKSQRKNSRVMPKKSKREREI